MIIPGTIVAVFERKWICSTVAHSARWLDANVNMKSWGHVKHCSYRSAVNRIDHQSNDHPQDVFPLPQPHTIPRISIWFQWFVIALPHSELQLLWHSHQNFIAYLINYFGKEVHFPPKRLPPLHYHKEWEEVETLRSVAAELRSCHHIFLYFRCLAAAPPMSSSTRWHWRQEAFTGQQLASHFDVFDVG